MFLKKILLVLSLVSAVFCVYEEEKYYRTPPPPRILSHKQAQNHDGGFKFAFAAENGLAQTEAISPDGSRNGGYTYVDPHGKTITVKYTAGKEGFRIIQGEHIPKEVQASPLQQQQTHQASHEYGKLPQPHYLRQATDDDGSYKPERYDNQKPAVPVHVQYPHAQLQQQAATAFHHHHQQEPKVAAFAFKPHYGHGQQQLQQQPQYVSVKAATAYAPLPLQLPQPRHYAPAHQEAAPLSNSVEDEDNPKEPEYHDEPGKPYSFGTGYTFHFSS